MTIYFSKSTIGFYDDEIIPISSIPDDKIEISSDQRNDLLSGERNGKVISVSEKGEPFLAEAPEPDATALKINKINEATDFINSKQWAAKTVLGRMKDEDLRSYNSWLDYLEELDNLVTDGSSELTWPQQPSE